MQADILDATGSQPTFTDTPLIPLRLSAAWTRLVPVLAAAILLAFTAVVPAATSPAIERKVEDLLARMTLEEKIGQLNLRSLGPLFPWEQLAEGKIGGLINFNDAGDIRRAQELAAPVAARHPAAVRPRRAARLSHRLPRAAGRGGELRPRPRAAGRRSRRRGKRRPWACNGPTPPWPT